MRKLIHPLVLFTVSEYLENNAKESKAVQDPFVFRLKGALSAYRVFHKLSQEEAKILIELGDDEVMKGIVDVEISFLIFSLELMKLWVEAYDKKERPNLNISDKKIKNAVMQFVVPMLKLKQNDMAKYKELKETITVSKMTAKKFLMYASENLDKDVK